MRFIDTHNDFTVSAVCTGYFGTQAPALGGYGVDLRPGILGEACFIAQVPSYE